MAPQETSTKNFSKPFIGALNAKEGPLTDEVLHGLLSAMPPSSPVPEKLDQRRKEKQKDEVDAWLDACSVSSYNDDYSPSKSSPDRTDIFLYNFFLRRNSLVRAAEYLERIESWKTDKMKNFVSEVRKLELKYIMLPSEKIDQREAQIRRIKESEARAESHKQKVAEDNARRIMSILTGKD